MVLNEKLEFKDAPPLVKKAFNGTPDKMYLKETTELYKFTSYPLVSEKGNVTPWWSFVHAVQLPNGRKAEGLHEAAERARRIDEMQRQLLSGAQRTRCSVRTYERARLAVSEEFNNSMRNYLSIALQQGVWGFVGIAAFQKAFKDPEFSNVLYIGGKIQLWLPNLTEKHFVKSSTRG